MVVRAVSDSLPALYMLFFLTLLMCTIFSSCMFYAEGTNYVIESCSSALSKDTACVPRDLPSDHARGECVRPTTLGDGWEVTPFRSIPFAFWWFFTTTTTVGYGDFFPTTTAGKFVGVLTAYFGIILLALPITIVGGNFAKEYDKWMNETEMLKEEIEAMKDMRRSVRKSKGSTEPERGTGGSAKVVPADSEPAALVPADQEATA